MIEKQYDLSVLPQELVNGYEVYLTKNHHVFKQFCKKDRSGSWNRAYVKQNRPPVLARGISTLFQVQREGTEIWKKLPDEERVKYMAEDFRHFMLRVFLKEKRVPCDLFNRATLDDTDTDSDHSGCGCYQHKQERKLLHDLQDAENLTQTSLYHSVMKEVATQLEAESITKPPIVLFDPSSDSDRTYKFYGYVDTDGFRLVDLSTEPIGPQNGSKRKLHNKGKLARFYLKSQLTDFLNTLANVPGVFTAEESAEIKSESIKESICARIEKVLGILNVRDPEHRTWLLSPGQQDSIYYDESGRHLLRMQ